MLRNKLTLASTMADCVRLSMGSSVAYASSNISLNIMQKNTKKYGLNIILTSLKIIIII